MAIRLTFLKLDFKVTKTPIIKIKRKIHLENKNILPRIKCSFVKNRIIVKRAMINVIYLSIFVINKQILNFFIILP